MYLDSYRESWVGIRWERQLEERLKDPLCLEQYGYKVYSQSDEDGIIDEIFSRIGVTNKKFIEFGVQDGIECNTHYLLFKGWTGLWIEGSPDEYSKVLYNFEGPIQTGSIRVENAFITTDNINDIFIQANFTEEIDLLSIDIDGNDWYVFEAINAVNPRVIIVEYNAKIPPDCEWVMKYNADHIWDGTDRHGASLLSLEKLGASKGYQLVGTNLSEANAFFVRKDLAKDLFFTPADARALYNPSRYDIKHTSGHPTKRSLLTLPIPVTTGYMSIKDTYDTEYYLEDCGGFQTYKETEGKQLDGRLNQVLSMARVEPGMRVLDIGCGRGELSYAIANEVKAEVWAIDYSQDAIALAKNMYGDDIPPDLHFLCMDIFEFNEGLFDRIIMADIVEHIEPPMLEKLFDKCSTLLREDGIIVIHTAPNRDYYEITYKNKVNIMREQGVFLPEDPRSHYEKLMHINEQTPQGLEATLQRRFSAVHVWTGDYSNLPIKQTTEEQRRDNDIFALATKSDKCLQQFISQSCLKPCSTDIDVSLKSDTSVIVGHRGDMVQCEIEVSNNGNLPLNSYCAYPINLSYHLLKIDGTVFINDGERTRLPVRICTGHSANVLLNVPIPSNLPEGEYWISSTLVAERCFWFDTIDPEIVVRVKLLVKGDR